MFNTLCFVFDWKTVLYYVAILYGIAIFLTASDSKKRVSARQEKLMRYDMLTQQIKLLEDERSELEAELQPNLSLQQIKDLIRTELNTHIQDRRRRRSDS
jgi:hypothetical protein